MIVHHVGRDGSVVDGIGRAVDGLPIAEGATLVDVGRTELLSAIVYQLADGSADPQPLHDQDEAYVVIAGRATAVVGDDTTDVTAGSVLIVPAGTPHRFVDPCNGFSVVAVFAPPLA